MTEQHEARAKLRALAEGVYAQELNEGRRTFQSGTLRDFVAMPTSGAARVALFVDRLTAGTLGCQRGCSFCCRGQVVEATAVEAVAIAQDLIDRLGDHAAGYGEELARDVDSTRNLSPAERLAEQVPCPFLSEETGDCMVYSVRPLACRGHTSADASQCERALNDETGATEVVTHIVPRVLLGNVQSALIKACDEAGIDSRTFELGSAVAVAISEPRAAERLAKGERLFDAAVVVGDDTRSTGAFPELRACGLVPPERLVARARSRNAAKRSRAQKKGQR